MRTDIDEQRCTHVSLSNGDDSETVWMRLTATVVADGPVDVAGEARTCQASRRLVVHLSYITSSAHA